MYEACTSQKHLNFERPLLVTKHCSSSIKASLNISSFPSSSGSAVCNIQLIAAITAAAPAPPLPIPSTSTTPPRIVPTIRPAPAISLPWRISTTSPIVWGRTGILITATLRGSFLIIMVRQSVPFWRGWRRLFVTFLLKFGKAFTAGLPPQVLLSLEVAHYTLLIVGATHYIARYLRKQYSVSAL